MKVPADEKSQQDVSCTACDGIGWVLSREIKVNGVPAASRCAQCKDARDQAAIAAWRREKTQWMQRVENLSDRADDNRKPTVKAVLDRHQPSDDDYECDACSAWCDGRDPVEWPCDVVLALIEAMDA